MERPLNVPPYFRAILSQINCPSFVVTPENQEANFIIEYVNQCLHIWFYKPKID